MDSPWLQFVPLLVVGVVVAAMVWMSGTIMKKTGRSRLWGVVWLMPGVNVVIWIWLALSDWPIERENRELRRSLDLLQSAKGAGTL